MDLDLRSSELEHAFIKERISNVEKHFSDMGSKFSAYLKKEAHYRDSGDDLSKSIMLFASKENLNKTVRTCLGEFSDILTALQEYREAKIQRTEVKTVVELANYPTLCKKAKNDLKMGFEARERELIKRSTLEKARAKNPTNWQKIAQAEKEVSQAQGETTLATNDLSRSINNFERRKIEDIKNILLDFIKIELIFHAKSIELFTLAFNKINDIQVEDDLQEFRDHFRACSAARTSSSFLQIGARKTDADLSICRVKSPIGNLDESSRSVSSVKSGFSKMEQSEVSLDSCVSSRLQSGDH